MRSRKPPSIDQKAYGVVVELIDEAEAWLVKRGTCEPADASDFLARGLFEQCASICSYGLAFMESDERIGADIFLMKLANTVGGRLKRMFNRNCRRYAECLQNNVILFFPNYAEVVRLGLLRALMETETADELINKGAVLLACATLPNALNDVRRELRRRGMASSRAIVLERVMNKRIETIARPARLLISI